MLEKLLRYALANGRKPLHQNYNWYDVIVKGKDYILKYKGKYVRGEVTFNLRQLLSLEAEFVIRLLYKGLFKYDDNRFYRTEDNNYDQRDIEYRLIEFTLKDEEEIDDVFKDNIKRDLIDKE